MTTTIMPPATTSTTAAAASGTLHELKAADEQLYREIVRSHASLARDREGRKEFFRKANEFVERLEGAASTGAITVDDYNWLSEAALRWEVIYASILNVPKTIVISASPAQLKKAPEQVTVFNADELERWLQVKAYELSRIRKVNQLLRQAYAIQRRIESTTEEALQDWRYAQVDFAWQVVSGNVNLVTQIASNSYERLQQVWLREVKQHRAFLIWEERGAPETPDSGVEDYLLACDQLRRLLGESRLKAALPEGFAETRSYLEQNYLDTKGRLDPEKPAAQAMIRDKAREIWLRCGDAGPEQNWTTAEARARQFYEHVIPAVTGKDAEATRLALEAFSWEEDGGTVCEIGTSFEAALAIYFFDPEVVQQVWQDSRAPLWP